MSGKKDAVSGKPDCGILIKLISEQMSRDANRRLGESGLTLSQIRYLEYLYGRDGSEVYFRDMEAYFRASQPTVFGIMQRLTGKGMTEILPAGKGRAKTVRLTEKGRAVVGEVKRNRQHDESRLLDPLSPDERCLFQDMLIRISENLQK